MIKKHLTNKHPIAVIVLLSLFCLGCKGKYCPGFPDRLMLSMPYAEDETIHFVNEENGLVELSVKDRYQEKEHYYDWNCKCDCGYPLYSIQLLYGNGEYGTYRTDTTIRITASIPVNPALVEYATADDLEFDLEVSFHPRYEARYTCQQRGDSVLFVLASDSSYFDSLVVVKGVGLTGFNTADGHKYELPSSTQRLVVK